MDGKFTQGPWRASAEGIWAKSPWNAEVKIASITVCSPMNGIDWKANAALIAAAPDMLAALEKTRLNLSGLSRSKDDVYAAMVRRIDASITKATGAETDHA